MEKPTLLDHNKSRDLLKKIDGWQLTEDHKTVYREFILRDFLTAVNFIERIAPIAQEENHHPDLHLTKFHNLRVNLTTHDAGGLTDKDFSVAGKINNLPQERSAQVKQASQAILSAKSTKSKAVKSKAKKTVNRVQNHVKKAKKAHTKASK